jgi:hypothetical protein
MSFLNNQNQQKAYTPIKRDMVMSVTSYDLSNHKIFGILSDGRKAEVQIDPEAYQRGVRSEQLQPSIAASAPYLGHKIDAKMSAKIIANKSLAVLENAEVVKKLKDGTRLMNATKIIAAGSNKTKSFEALMTFTYNESLKKAERIQVWDQQAISINNVDCINLLKNKLEEYKTMHNIEEIKLEEKKSSFWIPYVGFEFRTVDSQNNVIDLSSRFETKTVEHGEADNLTKFKEQMTSIDFDDMLKAYIDYSSNSYGENNLIEVTSYVSYPNGQFCKQLDFSSIQNGDYNPLLKMATAKTKTSIDSNDETGGNFGCWGVINLSKDSLNDQNEVVKRYYVSRIFANTKAKNYVHQKIKSSNDSMVLLSNNLKSTLMQYTPKQNVIQNTKKEQNSFWVDDNDTVNNEAFKPNDLPFNLGKIPSQPKAFNQRAEDYYAKQISVASLDDDDIPF